MHWLFIISLCVMCFCIPFHLFYYSSNVRDVDHFFFLNMCAKLPNSELFHGRNHTCFFLILPQYICWLYNRRVLEMNTHSVHIISKVFLFFFFLNKVSERELLKIAEVRWLGALRTLVLYPVIPSQPIWWLLCVSPLRTTGKPEVISVSPCVGMAGENTPFLYIQASGDP